jgi:CubicO group peptidase (beta-lactamase class C family)
MQRVLVTVVVSALVFAALLVGALAAHWPFWQRAWQWQVAVDGWPPQLPGPALALQPSSTPLPLHLLADARLAARARADNTDIIMVGDVAGHVAGWFAPGNDEHSVIDGRGMTSGLLAPLYGSLLMDGHASLLDVPLRDTIAEWHDGPRGAITARQLLWQLSGLTAGRFVPLNPASRRAQLASGPDFYRAAVHTRLTYPPGSHFEADPANAQLLALLAGRIDRSSYAETLQRRLWGKFAGQPAIGMLDHARGNLAAHCCLRAAAEDWLRLGLLLAGDGKVGTVRMLAAGYVTEMAGSSPVHPGYGFGYRVLEHPGEGRRLILQTTGRRLSIAPHTGRAVLWVGRGPSPVWLDSLLSAMDFPLGDSASGE